MANWQLPVLWEDKDIIVINKPPFVVVNRAESASGETVADWACGRLQIKNEGDSLIDNERRTFVARCGVAHRLDKETSGCLLIAKNQTALTHLLKQFHDRETKKEYLALVHGHLTPKEGTVRLPLSRSRFDREKWEIKYSGKMAETSWKVEKYFGSYSLVRLFPKTGRTHQIRVHLAHLGFPVFSDEKYLTRSKVAVDRKLLPFHFLHAQKIGFMDLKGEWQSVGAPLPVPAAKLILWMESG
ncbi:hypothetical protein A3A84_02430 [Candidatus Collierbacteria bacterium RIFCSPLOWO2_01_FULL_50_23]|uniref:Pseudouridine synthase RsuA/RluA-like domain-containing protein n=2 Tax=Candidatus Collieribacteriota TaxID=1752725 RepID=A0A1F5EXA6_9BACT|nr:MAG: hypothetical protein A3D09_00875 [Candidatus Collierbacteria bacterium RIFCSPHIGHO2_02_FULL_49_10]OGD72262.1 MAG: hypothetical protein A2703_02770 [Candidatus Collierbacteria bacterium RIFCSPHIGHO2_01_FULL_50_25]OGD73815.1 MAG: hypothetical protein A3A84_02430 [Candidatus Collierbacteria bacterium RIFCSPLOWO2_01_FULL_50_23]